MGYGRLSEADETAFKEELQRRAGSLDRPIVVFCEPDCWMSWNAAQRALSYGFRNLIWFPDGVDAWRADGLAGEKVTPWRPSTRIKRRCYRAKNRRGATTWRMEKA